MDQKTEKIRCYRCGFWGDGQGHGDTLSDAGVMGYCKHPGVDGNQHPSYGACGEEKTMVYCEEISGPNPYQHILTRRDFGCVLFKPINKPC